MEVPYEISKLDLSAKAEDSKANVSINNPELVAEETTTVSVVVTAENGSTKTYSISVKRGKDPNKELSKNNYLDSLTVDVGILSPVFDKEKTNYVVYLPFEVTSINIAADVEDKRYATLKVEGNSELSVGKNLFKFIVTAEDESTRTYTVTVERNKSLDNLEVTSNTYLKSLKLSYGKLNSKFDKKVNVYYYTKSNNKISIKEALPELEGNTVKIEKLDKAFVIIVETESGERGYYILIEKSSSILWLIIIIIVIILAILGVLYYLNAKKGISLCSKKSNVELDKDTKKEKKDKK